MKHIAVQDGEPVPYREFALNISSATDKIQVFTTNVQSKNNYALRIMHYALNKSLMIDIQYKCNKK